MKNDKYVWHILSKDYPKIDIHSIRKHEVLKEYLRIYVEIVEKTKTVPANYQLNYFFALECPEKERESYFEFLIQGFQSIETNEWLTHIEKNSLLIHLAILIQSLGYNLNLSINFRDALEEHYKKLYEDKIELPVKSLKDDWDILLNGLENDVRETFLNNIVYFVENKENGLASNIGNLYDQILIKEGIYKKETGRFISTVFSRILKKDNETELKWLKDLIQSYPTILKQDKSATSTFKKEVAHVNLENYSSEAQNEIKGIAKELKVKIKGDVEED